MNWKLFAGQTFHKLEQLAIKSNSSFVNKNYPYRRNFAFDLKRMLDTPQVIFDVGAFVGDLSLEFHQHFKTATIYSFEPVLQSFNKLKSATRGIEQINSYNQALGEKVETIKIPLFSEASITTLRESNYDSLPISFEEINVTRLDHFVAENKISKIDILKIDVEGYEFEVLRGAGDFLSKISCIITEVGYSRCTTKTHFSDMDRFMEENGFSLLNIYELRPAYNDRTKLFYSNNVYIKTGN